MKSPPDFLSGKATLGDVIFEGTHLGDKAVQALSKERQMKPVSLRVVAISDTHGRHRKLDVPEGDLLVHAGDMGAGRDWAELEDFNHWLGLLPHRHKVLVAGNHDFWFERFPEQAQSTITNATYLQDQSFEVEGFKIYGSPWQPKFGGWAFNLPRGETLAKVWAQIPEDVDLLVTHGPPHGILDRSVHGHLCGCESLATRLTQIQPQRHVFGHIHEAYGEILRGSTYHVNASVVDIQYRLANAPVVFDLER